MQLPALRDLLYPDRVVVEGAAADRRHRVGTGQRVDADPFLEGGAVHLAMPPRLRAAGVTPAKKKSPIDTEKTDATSKNVVPQKLNDSDLSFDINLL